MKSRSEKMIQSMQQPKRTKKSQEQLQQLRLKLLEEAQIEKLIKRQLRLRINPNSTH